MVPVVWTSKYPSKELLRREIAAEVDSVVSVVFKTFGKNNIRAIYFKGSASKQWDSIIDYVPEFSDVDIHVLFSDGKVFSKKVGKIGDAKIFSNSVERNYLKRVKKPFHIPRLQLLSLNDLQSKKFYTPSPKIIVKKIYGAEYVSVNITKKRNIAHAVSGIIEHDAFIQKLPYRLMDSNHKNKHVYLRDTFWRISSLGNNLLCLFGLSYNDAWSLNRTGVYRKLLTLGHDSIAEKYALFYKNAWDFFLTKNTKYADEAIILGHGLLEKGLKIAKDYRM